MKKWQTVNAAKSLMMSTAAKLDSPDRIDKSELVKKVVEAIRQGIRHAGIKTSEGLQNDTQFEKLIVECHGRLPLPYRLVLPKKIFVRQAYKVRDRLVFENGELTIDNKTSDQLTRVL